ncbi:Retrovirus-related Pol polyprotein from transposon opus [Exaiptasia diaphana]|nr:Retrovirus-related Pol polyprotein from transposon opus [Exaiptasia diaphana]
MNTASASAVSGDEYSEQISQLAAIHPNHARPTRNATRRRTRRGPTHNYVNEKQPSLIGHHVFSKGAWRRGCLHAHPTVNIEITPDTADSASSKHGRDTPRAEVKAIADTGAQSDIWSLHEFLACGFPREILRPVSLSLSAANRSPIPIEGAFFAKLSTTRMGKDETCRAMVYVSSAVNTMYLSCETLLNLGILPQDFPTDPNPSKLDSITITTRVPDCCPGGWRIALAGSRFLSPTEQRYAAIEGEPLAVAWGLEQTRYFTQGCDDLVVVTDHKPLTKILGDRTLDEITSSRLFRLKQRTLPWRFDIVHLPGKLNYAADATSRYPSPSAPDSPADIQESMLMAAIREETKELGKITWAHIAQETIADPSLHRLLSTIEQNDTTSYQSDPELGAFWPLRESIYSDHGVLMYQDRVIIPSPLRGLILQHLHSAHQGTSAMEFFGPG